MPSYGPYGLLITRTGDLGLGQCPAHSGVVTYITSLVSSNPNVTDYDIPVVTIGDIGISTCGHPTIALTGATYSFVNEKPIHRLTDMGTNPGPYIVITSSPTTDAI